MDKKTIMQMMLDGYYEMFKECRYDFSNCLIRITDCFDEEIKGIKLSRRFWDDISDERIAREQKKYLECQRRLEEIVSLIEDLETYIREKTTNVIKRNSNMGYVF